MLVVVAEQDHTVNPLAALAWAKKSGAHTFVSHGDCGHRIMECDGAAITRDARAFLASNRTATDWN